MYLLLAAQSVDLGPVQPLLFYGLALLLAISAWSVVFSDNIVRMAVFLLLALGAVGGLYFMLAAEFLAAVQLIVYAGGTLILIVFGVMLTSKNPFLQFRVKLWERMVALALALTICGFLIFALVNTPLGGNGPLAPEAGYEQVQEIGKSLLSTYLVPFEVAAVLLLVVMIGAAYMARRRAQ